MLIAYMLCDDMLTSCGLFRASLAVANGIGASTIAFPAISCGVYGYPLEHACNVSVHGLHALYVCHSDIWGKHAHL